MLNRWHERLRQVYPAQKPLTTTDAKILRRKLPKHHVVLHTSRYNPVFAVRVPKEILEVTHMLSELTDRRVSDTKKLIVLEGILHILRTSTRREASRRPLQRT